MRIIRVILADDQAEVRSGLKLLLEQEPDLAVTGEAADSACLLALAARAEADVVLLDWELPRAGALPLIPALRTRRPNLRVLALSGRPEARKAALAAGADAFVSKGDNPARLLSVLREVAYGCARGD
ncbi:MAG: response regulator [Patescibacteria group bacterium]